MGRIIDSVNACKYLYLDVITEPEVNALRIVVLEAATGGPVSDSEVALESCEPLRGLLASSREIEHFDGCKRFEISWGSYIGYSVVNESFSKGESKEYVGKGRLLVEYEKSNYLDYLSKASFATADYPGHFKHWAIYCLDHTIDVAAQGEPEIRVL